MGEGELEEKEMNKQSVHERRRGKKAKTNSRKKYKKENKRKHKAPLEFLPQPAGETPRSFIYSTHK
jgi:hypothetical protein